MAKQVRGRGTTYAFLFFLFFYFVGYTGEVITDHGMQQKIIRGMHAELGYTHESQSMDGY